MGPSLCGVALGNLRATTVKIATLLITTMVPPTSFISHPKPGKVGVNSGLLQMRRQVQVKDLPQVLSEDLWVQSQAYATPKPSPLSQCCFPGNGESLG